MLLNAELLALEKSVRITRSLIGKRLVMLNLEVKRITKLSRKNKLLNKITESVQDFKIRGCCKILDHMLLENEPISLWKVQKFGAVRLNYFYEIKPRVEDYIQMKRELES